MIEEKSVRHLHNEALRIRGTRVGGVTIDVIDVKLEYEIELLEKILQVKKEK